MNNLKKQIDVGSILIVDDSPECLRLLTAELRGQGYEVRPVPSGKLAVQAALNNPPDLILLDVMMPEMDGFEVCQTLKSNSKTKDIPIIFLTAMDIYENEAKALSMGAVDYIVKPIVIPTVNSRVNAHIQLKLQRDLLERQKADLMEMNNELEAFSYSASHDLKAPLTLIKTYSEFIREYFEDVNYEQGVEDIAVIEEASVKMSQLIESLLQLAKISRDSVIFEKTDLSGMTQLIFSELRAIDPSRSVEFFAESDMVAFVDPQMLRIALYNLIQNAWKYSSTNQDAKIEVGVLEQKGQKVFYIKDNGVGFDMTRVRDLFKPFTRLHSKDEFDGTGIGLAIVKRIIVRHNGQIWVTSEQGIGTTFYFTLHSEDTSL